MTAVLDRFSSMLVEPPGRLPSELLAAVARYRDDTSAITTRVEGTHPERRGHTHERK